MGGRFYRVGAAEINNSSSSSRFADARMLHVRPYYPRITLPRPNDTLLEKLMRRMLAKTGFQGMRLMEKQLLA
jgi:hypothetical protein